PPSCFSSRVSRRFVFSKTMRCTSEGLPCQMTAPDSKGVIGLLSRLKANAAERPPSTRAATWNVTGRRGFISSSSALRRSRRCRGGLGGLAPTASPEAGPRASTGEGPNEDRPVNPAELLLLGVLDPHVFRALHRAGEALFPAEPADGVDEEKIVGLVTEEKV